uniref:Uncharacterized protein n=1 Tax=Helicotheca tamesis TaxID=374047 RepID=A0A7S2I9F3_9STRA|mmetsp:Transcript_7038/g.9529  ORF Transcript_7038/g.9529 Transcript_7038/m.9529 type:complete len:105 (+) Transcript_7038:174-488(+)
MDRYPESTDWNSFQKRNRSCKSQGPMFGSMSANAESAFIDSRIYERQKRKENQSCAKKVFCCLSCLWGMKRKRNRQRDEDHMAYGTYMQTPREEAGGFGYGYST